MMYVYNVLDHVGQRREVFIEREPGVMIDGISQATNGLNDRQGAVAFGVELRQTAGFVARGHQQRITTGHRQVCERFGIADVDTDLPREAMLQLPELPLEVAITAADHHELGACCDQRLGRVDDHIEALLPIQSTDNDEDGSRGVIRQRKMLTKSRLADELARQVVLIIRGGQMRIVARIPCSIINPVENADQTVIARSNDRIEPAAVFTEADFFCVSRTDGRDTMGEQHSRFEKT